MYLLRNSGFLILSVFFVFISCKSQGAISPEEAFNSLKSAYLRSDAGALENLLSARSKEKIKTMISMISMMDQSQLEALSRSFDAEPGKLKNLTIEDYLLLYLHTSQQMGEDTLKEVSEYNIIGIDAKDESAVVRIENGMQFLFVKEGPYWKFDMEELSSKY